jgi:hypothetical protein
MLVERHEPLPPRPVPITVVLAQVLTTSVVTLLNAFIVTIAVIDGIVSTLAGVFAVFRF